MGVSYDVLSTPRLLFGLPGSGWLGSRRSRSEALSGAEALAADSSCRCLFRQNEIRKVLEDPVVLQGPVDDAEQLPRQRDVALPVPLRSLVFS